MELIKWYWFLIFFFIVFYVYLGRFLDINLEGKVFVIKDEGKFVVDLDVII